MRRLLTGPLTMAAIAVFVVLFGSATRAFAYGGGGGDGGDGCPDLMTQRGLIKSAIPGSNAWAMKETGAPALSWFLDEAVLEAPGADFNCTSRGGSDLLTVSVITSVDYDMVLPDGTDEYLGSDTSIGYTSSSWTPCVCAMPTPSASDMSLPTATGIAIETGADIVGGVAAATASDQAAAITAGAASSSGGTLFSSVLGDLGSFFAKSAGAA